MLSIIILCYNIPSYEKKCIESVIKHTTVEHEIILVNNNGTQESKQQCIEYNKKGLKYIELRENKSVANAWNSAIRECKYDCIAILNNDTMVTQDWDKRLLRPFKQPGIGMTGPTMSYAGTSQKDEKSYQVRHRMRAQDIDKHAERHRVYFKDIECDMNHLDGSCFMISKPAFNIIGEFNEEFKVGFGEIEEWTHRATKAGFRLIWVKHCYVHHYGGISFSQRETLDHGFNKNELIKVNGDLLEIKLREVENNDL